MWRYWLFFVGLLLSCNSVKELPLSEDRFAPPSVFQLMSPRIEAEAVFFNEKTQVDMLMDFPKTDIRYALDGKPVGSESELYNKTFTINRTTTLQAKAYHPDCKASEVIAQPFYKVSKVFDRAKLSFFSPYRFLRPLHGWICAKLYTANWFKSVF